MTFTIRDRSQANPLTAAHFFELHGGPGHGVDGTLSSPTTATITWSRAGDGSAVYHRTGRQTHAKKWIYEVAP